MRDHLPPPPDSWFCDARSWTYPTDDLHAVWRETVNEIAALNPGRSITVTILRRRAGEWCRAAQYGLMPTERIGAPLDLWIDGTPHDYGIPLDR